MVIEHPTLPSLTENYKEVLDLICQYDDIFIYRHIRPDPDAIGSQLGLKAIINKNFPNKNVFALGEDEPSLEVMGTMDSMENYEKSLAIVLDTANSERIDGNIGIADKVIKIDHHPNNEPYGDINIVETSLSSTSELIYLLCKLWDFDQDDMSDYAAQSLYLGIVGDTGRFLFDNTTERTLSIAADLKSYEFNATHLMTQMSQISMDEFKFKGYLSEHFTLTDSGVCYAYISQNILKKYNTTSNVASQFVNIFRDLNEVKIWFLIIEETDHFRVRLRSKEVVINDVAEKFGGGGHPLASGVKLSTKAHIPLLVEALEQKLK